jgi:hypothetical protein
MLALEEMGNNFELGLGAGLGLTIRANQVEAYKYKALPPLPI